jgi:NAD(P)-dependent dehydrogenase (short-subunit alcohol dehydrogenase family)
MDLTATASLVTGGTRGIGAATAIAFAERASNVAIVGRRIDDEAKGVRQKIESLGRKCVLIQGDMAKPADAARSVEETVKHFGTIDLLVHSAGGPVNGGLLDLTAEAWQNAFDVHVHAVFHLCRAAVPIMRKKKSGSIVLISSTAGIRGIRTNVAYQVVKGALPQFTRALAFEFADDNIRINCVAPGVVRTDFHAKMTPETRKHNLDNRIPLHREGTPEQVATLIREVATNDYVTGETFVIDGGLTMRIC